MLGLMPPAKKMRVGTSRLASVTGAMGGGGGEGGPPMLVSSSKMDVYSGHPAPKKPAHEPVGSKPEMPASERPNASQVL